MPRSRTQRLDRHARLQTVSRASLSELSGPAAVDSDEVLPAVAPQQTSGRRRGRMLGRRPTPPELTRADSEAAVVKAHPY